MPVAVRVAVSEPIRPSMDAEPTSGLPSYALAAEVVSISKRAGLISYVAETSPVYAPAPVAVTVTLPALVVSPS